MNTVLISGGNGFLGSHLCKRLRARGDTVRALVYPGTSLQPLHGLDVETFEGDITKKATLLPAMQGVTHVVHLAAKVSDWGPEAAFHTSIVTGTDNMVRTAIDAGAKRFVHMSSLAVHRYHDHTGSDESAPLDGDINAYARTKAEAERLLGRIASEIETVIVRPGLMPYGPGDLHAFPQLAKTIENGLFRLVDDGRYRFGTSYVDNLIHGLELCLHHPQAVGETFVLADDDVLNWKQMANDVARALGAKPVTANVPLWLARAGGVACETLADFGLMKEPPLTRYRIATVASDLVFSNAKAKRLLGYEPKVHWSEGLATTVAWYRQHSAKAAS